jgi:hypothetical protein
MAGGARFLGQRGTKTMILGLQVAIAFAICYVVMWGVRLALGHTPNSPGYEVLTALPFLLGISAGLYYFFHVPAGVDIL